MGEDHAPYDDHHRSGRCDVTSRRRALLRNRINCPVEPEALHILRANTRDRPIPESGHRLGRCSATHPGPSFLEGYHVPLARDLADCGFAKSLGMPPLIAHLAALVDAPRQDVAEQTALD